nr:MerR family DNA-binding transcriptional regulator [Candidatus Cyanaurora vandensis]
MPAPLTIQEVATLTKVSVHTLRYYERIGYCPRLTEMRVDIAAIPVNTLSGLSS